MTSCGDSDGMRQNIGSGERQEVRVRTDGVIHSVTGCSEGISRWAVFGQTVTGGPSVTGLSIVTNDQSLHGCVGRVPEKFLYPRISL